MHGFHKYANVCSWPKAAIETESEWVFFTAALGEKSGHWPSQAALIGADLL